MVGRRVRTPKAANAAWQAHVTQRVRAIFTMGAVSAEARGGEHVCDDKKE